MERSRAALCEHLPSAERSIAPTRDISDPLSRSSAGFSFQRMQQSMAPNAPVFPEADNLSAQVGKPEMRPEMRPKCRRPRPRDYIQSAAEAALAESVWALANEMIGDEKLYHRVFSKMYEAEWAQDYKFYDYFESKADRSSRQFHPPRYPPWTNKQLGIALLSALRSHTDQKPQITFSEPLTRTVRGGMSNIFSTPWV